MHIDYKEIGETGLRRSGGVIREEFLPELRGAKWLRVVKEMSEQDSIVTAELLAIEMLLRQVDWRIAAGDDGDEGAAEFVDSCMADMSSSWEDTLSEILTMLPYGYSYMELVYKKRDGDNPDPRRRSKHSDGRIGWRKWAIRSQDTLYEWEFDSKGGIRGFWQRVDGESPVLIPIEKALLFRTSARKGNPEGRSVLRGAYRSYYFKKNMENIEGVGVERDLAGLPVAHVPPEILSDSANATQQALLATIKDVVVNIRRDDQEGIVWPLAYDDNGREMFRLELLSAPGARQFDIGSIIQRYNTQIAMSTLADFITLGHEQVGSYSLSATKDTLFKTALEAWLQSIADVINTHAIPKLLKLNGMSTESPPKMVFGGVGKVELNDMINFINAATSAGMQLFPSVEVENTLRNQVRLPLLDEDEANEREKEEDEAMAMAARRVLERGF